MDSSYFGSISIFGFVAISISWRINQNKGDFSKWIPVTSYPALLISNCSSEIKTNALSKEANKVSLKPVYLRILKYSSMISQFQVSEMPLPEFTIFSSLSALSLINSSN